MAQERETSSEAGAASFQSPFSSGSQPSAPAPEETAPGLMGRERERIEVNGDEVETDDLIGLFMKDVGKIPLLSREEEVELGRTLRQGKLARRKLRHPESLSPEKKTRLERLVKDGEEARETMVKHNFGLVVTVAGRYIGLGLSFPDLRQEGNIGLIKAIDKFDYRRGYKLSTYATWWIRQSIVRALANQGRTIRLPTHVIDKLRKIHGAAAELQQQLGRSPTNEEIAGKLGTTPGKVAFLLDSSQHPLSLEQPVGEDDDTELGHLLEDESVLSPVDGALRTDLKERMTDLLKTLPARERKILQLHFGLEDGRHHTLAEIGQRFGGVTRERIRQIQEKALKELRRKNRAKQLRNYLK